MESLNAWEAALMSRLGSWGGLTDSLMRGISALGDYGILMILTALVLLCFRKTRRCGLAAAIALAAGAIVGNGVLKPLVARVRPYDFDPSLTLLVPPQNDFSFPSGHTLAAFETAVPILRYHRKWGIAALAFAGLMAFSRVYGMVHYPTDVLAGALIGTACGLLGVAAAEKIAQKTGKL